MSDTAVLAEKGGYRIKLKGEVLAVKYATRDDAQRDLEILLNIEVKDKRVVRSHAKGG